MAAFEIFLYSMLMTKGSSNNGSAHVVIIIGIIAALMVALGLVYWKNVATQSNNNEVSVTGDNYNSDDWSVYEDDELPFIFDYPKDWRVVKEEGAFFLLDGTSEKMISIRYVEMPPGLSRGVSVCQIKTTKTEKYCSYIDNALVDHFFGRTEDNEWRGQWSDRNADIILTLISKNQKTRSLLTDVAESIRLSS
jgi:hypothetical protein